MMSFKDPKIWLFKNSKNYPTLVNNHSSIKLSFLSPNSTFPKLNVGRMRPPLRWEASMQVLVHLWLGVLGEDVAIMEKWIEIGKTSTCQFKLKRYIYQFKPHKLLHSGKLEVMKFFIKNTIRTLGHRNLDQFIYKTFCMQSYSYGTQKNFVAKLVQIPFLATSPNVFFSTLDIDKYFTPFQASCI